MKIYRYETSLARLWELPEKIVFLAGPTVRGNQLHLTSWRPAAIEEFAKQGFDGILVLPEFTERTQSDKGVMWVPYWEYAGLCGCDVIMFWVPRTKELIGLTTNHEHGFWLGRCPQKMIYGRPDDSYRNTYLDFMWDIQIGKRDFESRSRGPGEFYFPIQTTLEDTVRQSINLTRLRGPDLRYQSQFRVESPYGAF